MWSEQRGDDVRDVTMSYSLCREYVRSTSTAVVKCGSSETAWKRGLLTGQLLVDQWLAGQRLTGHWMAGQWLIGQRLAGQWLFSRWLTGQWLTGQ